MGIDTFLDTNVLIYAGAGRISEFAKQWRALACVEAANFGTSGQVLAEFNSNVTRKPARPLIIPITADLVRMAVGLSAKCQVTYWDAEILAAVEELGAPTLDSEGLSHGQIYGSVKVVNPFLLN